MSNWMGSLAMACLKRGKHVAASYFLLAALPQAAAQTPEEFYRGKSVSLIVSSAEGGGYDATARLTARHLGRHIPGQPTIIVRNMPGAGGIRAPNFVYHVAEKDGSIISLMQNSVPFEPLAGNKAATFDPLKLLWLGSPNVEIGIMTVWHGAGVRTIADLQNKEITVGVPSAASTPAFNARTLIQVIGARLKLIPGYPSSNATLLAMERGEVDSFPNFYNSMVQQRPDWIRDKKVHIIVQWGPFKEKALPDVPFLPDMIKDPAKLALLKVAAAPLALGRPFMMAPGNPQDRFAAMRKAMIATFNDPEFAKDAARIGFSDLAPQSGEELEKVIREVYASPPSVIENLKLIAAGDGK